MQFHPLLMGMLAADQGEEAPSAAGLLPLVLALVFLVLAVLAVVLLLSLVVIEGRRLALTRKQLQVQILTHLQASYPGAETDLEFLPGEPTNYKEMSPDAREAAKAFFDFWAERFHWNRLGLVDPVIWGAWDRGVAQQLQRAGLRMAWTERHAREATFAQAFKDYINKKLR
jgi:hypothetical protein